MWNEPTPEQLARIHQLYRTTKVSFEDKIIHLHFLIPGQDTKLDEIFPLLPTTRRRHQLILLRYSFHWYIAEYDGEDLFYGYANLGDPQMAEWGYSSFTELREPGPYGIHVIHDTLWAPKKFADICQTSEAKPEPHTDVEVHKLPNCDFCKVNPTPAAYDGKTIFGPWANMCDTHFQHFGIGLGLGKGQKFVLKHKRPEEIFPDLLLERGSTGHTG